MNLVHLSARAAIFTSIFLTCRTLSDDYTSVPLDDQPSFGGSLLNRALNVILQPDPSRWKYPQREYTDASKTKLNDANAVSDLKRSGIAIRCKDHLACEYPLPAVEIDNSIIYNGILYLNDVDDNSKKALRDINLLYGTKEGYLPSTMVQHGNLIHWLHGPKIELYDASDPRTYPGGKPLKCLRNWNTSAYFLHPWEAANAYHSLNDNVFSVLANIVMHHITPLRIAEGRKTLFLFNRMVISKNAEVTHIFRILNWLFEGDVRPARALLEGLHPCHSSFLFRSLGIGFTINCQSRTDQN
jgi:hypothetical protein